MDLDINKASATARALANNPEVIKKYGHDQYSRIFAAVHRSSQKQYRFILHLMFSGKYEKLFEVLDSLCITGPNPLERAIEKLKKEEANNKL